MKLEHAALWTEDLERSRAFYQRWFEARANQRYTNPRTGFASYFLAFGRGDARLELMQMPGVAPRPALAGGTQTMGLVHLAFAVGTPAEVDALTARMREAGVAVLDGPRRTGDGYYESVVADPDGNRVELCAD